MPGETHKVLRVIAETFNKEKVFKRLRRQSFMIQSLNNNTLKDFNIFEWQFLDDEFLLGVLWCDNAFHFHVCCFSKQMIVDGNLPYALNLCQEALNVICQCDYKRLFSGLYFHKRKEAPIGGKTNKRKR